MSTLTFTGSSQAQRRKSPYDLWKEAGNQGDETAYLLSLHGLTVAQVALYKRSPTTPDTFEQDGGGDVIYTFSDGSIEFYVQVSPVGTENPSSEGWYVFSSGTYVLTTDTTVVQGTEYFSKESTDAGWKTSPYTDSGDLYVIYASANSKDSSDLIEPSEWSVPAILSESAVQGDPGTSGCVLYIFRASSSDTAPALPSQACSFNFTTKIISDLNNNWTQTPVSGDRVWVSTAIATSTSNTASIPTSAWSTPQIWKQKGDTGVSITGTSELYAVNNDEDTAPSSGWDTFDNVKSQIGINNRYLWNKETISYSDSTSTTLSAHIVFRYVEDGDDAKNISSIEEWFSFGTSSASDGNWSQTPKTPSSTTGENYVWQRERLKFDDNSYSTYTTPHMIAMWIKGDKGDTGATWYTGTSITGTTTFTGGHAGTLGDLYLNTSLNNVYECTTEGDSSTAVWTYKMNIKGATGDTGASGATWYSGTAITGTTTFTGGHAGSLGDMYLNTSTDNVYECTTAGDSSTAIWTYKLNIKGSAGAAATVCDFISDSQTFATNLRLFSSDGYKNTIELTGDVQGYSVGSYLWTVSPNTCSFSASTSSSTDLYIPYTTTSDVEVTFSIYDANSTLLDSKTRNISPIDVTEYNHDFGIVDSFQYTFLDGSSLTNHVLKGDFLVAKGFSDSVTYPDGTPWVYNGSTYEAMTIDTEDPVNTSKMFSTLGNILSDSEITVPSSSATYGWFKNLVGQEGVFKNLLSRNIKVSSSDENFIFNAKSYDSDGNFDPVFEIKYREDENSEYSTIFSVNVNTGVTSMKNATISGSFSSSGFSTSEAGDDPTTISSYTSANWGSLYNAHLWANAVANAVQSNFDNVYYNLNAVTVAKRIIEDLFTTSRLNLSTINTDANVYGVYPTIYIANISGTYLGQSFDQIAYIKQREGYPYYATVKAGVGGNISGSNVLYIAYESSSYTNIQNYSNASSATVGGTTYTHSSYFHSKILQSSDISSFSSTYGIPMESNVKITEGTISANGTTISISDSSPDYSLYLSSSYFSIVCNTDDSNTKTFNAGTSGYSTTTLTMTGVDVETSKDGIKTKHILPYSDSTYELGTDTNRYKRIYGDEVWGAVFN